MENSFDNLFISSPNDGGLFFIYNNRVVKLDSIDTTGLTITPRVILRGVQPGSLYFLNNCGAQCKNVTRNINDIHDVLIHDGHCYIVDTSRNSIVKFNSDGEEVKSFTYSGAEDAKHINCLAVWNGRVFFSAFGDFTKSRGYKDHSSCTGFVQDLLTGKQLIKGLSQPHSLTILKDNLVLANSEEKEIREYSPDGTLLRVKKLNGYTRGISVVGDRMYVGLSSSRNIASSGIEHATLVALDADSWEFRGDISLPVKEIYSVISIGNDRDAINSLMSIASHSNFLMRQAVSERDNQIAALISQFLSDQEVPGPILANQQIPPEPESFLHLYTELQQAKTTITAMRKTLSWRLTKPLRVVRRMISYQKQRRLVVEEFADESWKEQPVSLR